MAFAARFHISFRVLLAFVALAHPAWANEPLRFDPSNAVKIDEIVKKELKNKGVPSASIGVVMDGRVAFLRAYGQAQLSPNRSATTTARYGIGSISKQFLAVALLMLEAEGRISLDDKAGKYLSDLGAAGEVTLRQLLSHTAGIRDYWPQDYVMAEMREPIARSDLIERWARRPLDFTPGERWQYSNTGYTLAGAILEKVTGESLFGFLQRKVFVPLKMSSVVDIDQGRLGADDAIGYTAYGLGPIEPAPKEAPGWLFAAGELAMTADDLTRWDISIIDRTLLTPVGYHALETDTLLNNGAGTRYGLGVGVKISSERRVLSHTGGVSGFTARNTVYPDNRAAIVVLTNSDANDATSGITMKLEKLLFLSDSPDDSAKRDLARQIFDGLRRGKIDRTLFTTNCNHYYSANALRSTARKLVRWGPLESFELKEISTRGGMEERSYKAKLKHRELTILTRSLPDGRIEQFTLYPE
jgi:CubicO group peptidase (beta-lactamase class C family)